LRGRVAQQPLRPRTVESIGELAQLPWRQAECLLETGDETAEAFVADVEADVGHVAGGGEEQAQCGVQA
jgi:hypothetical protein